MIDKVRITILLVVIVGMVSLIFFAPVKGVTGNKGPITIGVEQSSLLALMMIAEDQGMFSKQGVDVAVKYYTTGKLALGGMFSGEVEFATPAETPIVFTSFERMDFSIVATIGSSDNDQAIIARKDRGIQKPKTYGASAYLVPKGQPGTFFCTAF